MPKVYTRKGDQGTTCLSVKSGRIRKDDDRVEALGDIDELNVWIGRCRLQLATYRLICPFDLDSFDRIQRSLMNIMSAISMNDYSDVKDVEYGWIEHSIDRVTQELPPLTQFILPGTCLSECDFHMARVVARRAERSVVRALHKDDGWMSWFYPPSPNPILPYINRLSDLFFTLARWMTHGNNAGEKLRHGK